MLNESLTSKFSYTLPRMLTRDIFLLRKIFISAPDSKNEITEQYRLNRQAAIMRFFEGTSAITQFWPLFFFSAFGYDLFNYIQAPQNRYALGLDDLLLGFSKNDRYDSLSINMGGDLYTQLNFWPFAFFYGSAFLLGLVNSFIRWLNPRYYDSLIPESDRSLKEKIRDDFFGSFPNLSPVSRSLAAIRFKLIWKNHPDYRYQEATVNMRINENRSEDEQYLHEIQQMAEKGSFFVKWQAVCVLADIIYYQNPQVDKIAADSLAILKGRVVGNKFIKDPISFVLAQFKLFSIGHSQYPLTPVLCYAVVIPLLLLSQWRFWVLLFSKFKKIIEYQYAKNNCEEENKIYRLVDEIGNYLCTYCNYPYIDYRRSNLPEACLNALLSFEQDPQKLLNELDILKAYGPYETIDFSFRQWFDFSIKNWQAIWKILQSNPFNTATILNLSQSISRSVSGEYYVTIGQAL
jgi:hypothetical protein